MDSTHGLRRAGLAVLRYGPVFLLVLWGAFKLTAFEAEAIQPLVSYPPFLSWLYRLFGVRTTNPAGGSLMKDILLLGAALSSAGEALFPAAARPHRAS